MTDHEPVNIMGVFAFPNPDRDNRMIRFIDSEYNTLFTVKDGERIVLTNLDDQTEILACTYIDDCHTISFIFTAISGKRLKRPAASSRKMIGLRQKREQSQRDKRR